MDPAYRFPRHGPVERAVTFEGGEDSGDVFNQQGPQLGTYSLTGLTVKFTAQIYTSQSLGYLVYVFDGALSDDAHMGGSLIGYYSNFSQVQANGTWSGTR